MSSDPPCVPVPLVTGELGLELGEKCSSKYAGCTPQPFLQNWVEPGKLPAEQGVGYVGCTAKALYVYAYFEDNHIFSTAQADQEKMWTLGDVFEVFVKPGADRADYWEVHVTPNDFLMDIHIPDRDQPYTWAEAVAPGTGATKLVKVATGSWAVELCIPWLAFGAGVVPISKWSCALCRYN
jgi:hypothetical protein